MTKIMLLEDHHLIRDGIKKILLSISGLQVVAEAANGSTALELLETASVDLVLLDINVEGLNGIEVAKVLRKEHPDIKILVLTMHDTYDYIRQMLELGVDGYLMKTTSKEELQMAIEKIMSGGKYYSEDVQKSVMSSFSSDNVSVDIHLTQREREILELICAECNTNEIAEKLFISTYTVETHRKNLLSKTGSKNVAGLVKFAIENKIIGG